MNTHQQTPIDLLLHWAQTRPDAIYLHQPVDRVWHSYSWSQVLDQASRIASALQQQGLPRGSRIAIISKNCAHWIIADLAIMLGGYVSVPLFQNQSSETTQYVLQHAEVKLAFVGKLDEPARVDAALPADLPRIVFPYPDALPGLSWDQLLASHTPLPLDRLPAMDEMATIMYTSGTTGNPKGAVHRFRQVSYAASQGCAEFAMNDSDRFFSYLPLSHAAERFMVEMISLYGGVPVYFTESLATFPSDLKKVQPTLFFSVPRLWTRFQLGILQKLPQAKLDRLLRIPLLRNLLKARIKRGLGLAKARMIVTGAAATPPALLHWYARLGIPIQEGYAMTEAFCYGLVNRPGKIRIGSVGQPLPDCQLRISDAGEIQLKNAALMDEYYREPEKSAEVLTADGWYRSGDIGEVDQQGYLHITGRLKDQFKTAKGKFVDPAPIEGKLLENQYLEQICLMGSDLPCTVAVSVLAENAQQLPHVEVSKSLRATLDNINAKLDKHEQIGRLIILRRPWSIEGGELTPTLKLKRHIVEQRQAATVQAALAQSDTIYWEQ